VLQEWRQSCLQLRVSCVDIRSTFLRLLSIPLGLRYVSMGFLSRPSIASGQGDTWHISPIRLFVTKIEYGKDPNKQTDWQTKHYNWYLNITLLLTVSIQKSHIWTGDTTTSVPHYLRSQVVFVCWFHDILFHQNTCFTLLLTKKLQPLGDFVPQTPYQGSAPGPRWGTSVPDSLLSCYVPKLWFSSSYTSESDTGCESVFFHALLFVVA